MKGSAVFDKERKYRYSLKRTWDKGSGKVVFILLNPGPADEDKNDKTTEKCISFAKSFGYGSMEIVNLFAYITTDVSELKLLSKEEAVGKDNDNYLIRALNSADKIIAAWGENAVMHGRHREIEKLLAGCEVDCLGTLTKYGFPRHPLKAPNDVELHPFNRPAKKCRTFPGVPSEEQRKGDEGTLIEDGKEINDDSFVWCRSCSKDFSLNGTGLCRSCYESEMDEFEDFLRLEYGLSENTALDYKGRIRGIVKRGLYNGEQQMTPGLEAAIEKEFPKSKYHYVLAVKRYIEFQKKKEQSKIKVYNV